MGGIEFWDDYFGQFHKKQPANIDIVTKEECIEQMIKQKEELISEIISELRTVQDGGLEE